jgi:hypothetical protein
MTKPILTKSQLAGLTPLELQRKVSVKVAAEMNDVSEVNFRRHYRHLIRKISPRRDVVSIADAIDLPPKPT